jgi:hypothetical protein
VQDFLHHPERPPFRSAAARILRFSFSFSSR